MSVLAQRTLSVSEQSNARVVQDATPAISLLVPTATALTKGIMDAIAPFREFLRAEGIHDFSQQRQGQGDAVRLRGSIVTTDDVKDTQVSLYRPNTKRGDPRVWFSGLPAYAAPGELLGVVSHESHLYVLNLTRSRLAADYEAGRTSAEVRFVEYVRTSSARDALDLLALLRGIAQRGPIPANGTGSTAVGRTLETLLGVVINSAKAPDWRGIELKSYRSQRENRKTLFAQVPDWSVSPVTSSAEILRLFGYPRDETFKLYVEVSCVSWNSRGMRLLLDAGSDSLLEISSHPVLPVVAVWPVPMLRARLRAKHRETFWVEADSTFIDGVEHFVFKRVRHTRRPVVAQLEPLLSTGHITMDHLIKRVGARVSEKGPLFKIDRGGDDLLFPEPRLYDLMT